MKSITSTYNLIPFQTNQLKKQLEGFKVGKIIYPATLKTKLNIEILVAYKILDDVAKLGYITPVFEVYCSKCQESNNVIVKNIVDFNEQIGNCNECNHELSFLDDTIRLYRVIKDD